MRLKPYLLPLAQFILIGPGIGALTALLLGSIGGAPTLSVGGGFLLFGYIIGLPPAALAGVIYVCAWNTRALLTALSITEFGALLGAISGLISLAAIFTITSGNPIPKSPIIYIIPMAAGAVCGWLAAHVRDEAYGWINLT